MAEPIKIPVNELPYKNTEEDALDLFGDVLIDGFIETIPDRNIKVSRKRPGLGTKKIDLGTNKPVDGIYWWNGRKCGIAVSDGRVFKITNAAGTLTATQLTGATIDKGTNVTFCETGSTLTGFKLILAARGKIYYSNDGVVLQAVADADAPTAVSHVAFLDQYILANKTGTGEFYFSAVGDYTDWSPTDFFSAEAKPDDLVALLTAYREIYLLGEQTIEVWYNDGVTPFSRVTMLEYGTLAPYSACFDGGDLYFLNQEKKICRLVNGRTPQILSQSYDKFIQTHITTISDAKAYILSLEGKKWYVCNFPTENRTIVYDINENAWYEWGKYQVTAIKETQLYNRFLGNCYAFCPDWGMNLLGSRLDGKIYDMSFNNHHDDEDIIRFVKRTGNISHGTSLKKISSQLLWRATSGKGKDDGSEDFFTFRFRDDGRKVWSNERQVSLGARGNYKTRKKFCRLGMYETRQYEIVHATKAPFTLIEAEELVEVLNR